jgi:hypothetical protein
MDTFFSCKSLLSVLPLMNQNNSSKQGLNATFFVVKIGIVPSRKENLIE